AGARHFHLRPGTGRQFPVAKAGGRPCPVTPGLADVRPVCLRLPVRICWSARCGTRRRGHWRAGALRSAALPGESAVSRFAGASGRHQREPGGRDVSRGSEKVQLPLALRFEAAMGRDDFFPSPSNEEALRWIETWPQWPSRVLVLIGPAGSGKTHLANIWCGIAGARMMSAETLHRYDVTAFAA